MWSSATKVCAQYSFCSCWILRRGCFNRLLEFHFFIDNSCKVGGATKAAPKCSTETWRHSRNHHIWTAGTPHMDNDVKPDFPTTHVVVGGYPLFSFWMTWETQQPKRETTALRGKIEARIPYYGQNEPAFWTMFRPHLEQTARSLQTVFMIQRY